MVPLRGHIGVYLERRRTTLLLLLWCRLGVTRIEITLTFNLTST